MIVEHTEGKITRKWRLTTIITRLGFPVAVRAVRFDIDNEPISVSLNYKRVLKENKLTDADLSHLPKHEKVD